MVNFHEHKLWQESYVALMDIHEVVDNLDVEEGDRVVSELVDASQKVSSTIADALTRVDRQVARQLLYDAVGLVAVTRTQMAIAWGRGLFDDETFRAIDGKYASLSTSLQQFK